jgi:Ribbon-helix-helix domain
MPATDLTRLTISWSKDTDLALRTYLGARGMKKGDLSAFIEEAVRWRLFDETVETIKDRNADAEPDAVMDLIDATVRDVRAEMASERKAAGRSR